MFALIESGPAPLRHGEWASRTLSLGIHAALITAAVLATKQVALVADPPLVVVPNLRWPTAPTHPLPTSCGACQLPGRDFPIVVPHWVPDPGLVIPLTIPIAAPGAPSDTVGFIPGPPSANPMLTGAQALDARVVDEPPEMLSHPEPRYPELLRQAGIEGRVVVEAVIDTAGRAEAGSLRIISATHPLFGAEAEQVVLAARYRAGRMDAHAVRVRVRIPISFGIRR